MQIKLTEPIEIADKKLETVEIKEVWNAGDFIDIQDAGKGEGSRCCRQVAIAIDMPDPVVRKLSVNDFTKILEESSRFFTKSTKKAKANT